MILDWTGCLPSACCLWSSGLRWLITWPFLLLQKGMRKVIDIGDIYIYIYITPQWVGGFRSEGQFSRFCSKNGGGVWRRCRKLTVKTLLFPQFEICHYFPGFGAKIGCRARIRGMVHYRSVNIAPETTNHDSWINECIISCLRLVPNQGLMFCEPGDCWKIRLAMSQNTGNVEGARFFWRRNGPKRGKC